LHLLCFSSFFVLRPKYKIRWMCCKRITIFKDFPNFLSLFHQNKSLYAREFIFEQVSSSFFAMSTFVQCSSHRRT
jgi:hypothetical protein